MDVGGSMGSDDRWRAASGCRRPQTRVGNYVVGEQLGRGAFGQVHKAYSLYQDPVRICAAKKLSAESDYQMTGAIKELNILENLKPHQHIAKFIEHKRDVPAKRQLAFQLADAVAFLHDQHIVHRDLKPQNLMIKDGTDFPILKVVDFGLATVCSRLDPTKVHDYFSGSLGGTLFYVAPEVLSAGQNWTTAVDVFSMGLLFWAMFDNLNATSNTDLEPYLAPFVKSPTGAGYNYSEPIGQVLARGGSVDHKEVMRNDPQRRNLVFTMIDPDYKKRPTASEVFNNLKMIEDGYTGYTDTEDRNDLNESYQQGNVDRSPS
ncbi:hypothetical protein Bbelb_041720 [Branchiostoma belcheri]|nr:hypothetical protein Bbelb_041720 [Branchiostoma belcheri]